MKLVLPSPLEKINFPTKNGISLYIKRDDLIHQYVSGNKWRKLKFNIFSLLEQNKQILLTVGGAFSNHIMACAAASHFYNIKSIGIIRGEELNENSNANLKYAAAQGMKLIFIDRNTYSTRYDDDFLINICNKYNLKFDDIYIVPEGGANDLAMKGCEEIIEEIDLDFDYICTACGTGTTLFGLTNKLQSHQSAIGIDVLKYNFSLDDKISSLNLKNIEILHEYHFGGYSKKNETLVNFIQEFYMQTNIKLDYVYTGKMMFAIFDLMNKDYFKPNSKIIALHTGGILNANCIDEI
jgi:1-aminocyclopropane-1-carboxylate deaminase